MTTPAATPPKEERILRLPLSDILFDEAWNARSRAATVASGEDDEKAGFEGLLLDLYARGQQDPVDVVELAPGGKAKYAAVTGFRRGRALAMIARGVDLKTGRCTRGEPDPGATVLARVRAYSPLEARVRNLAENANRADLSAADLAFGIGEIKKIAPRMSAQEIGERVGLSVGYVTHLASIVQKVHPPLFTRWRGTPGCPVGVDEMLAIARLPTAEEQHDAFDEVLRGRAAKDSGRGQWRGSAKRRAARLGRLLGLLAKARVDLASGLGVDWLALLDAASRAGVVPVREVRSEGAREEIARAMAGAFMQELDRKEIPPVPKLDMTGS